MKTLLVTIIAAVALLLMAFLLMGVKALFVKGGEFPSGHVHELPQRRRRALWRLEQIRLNKRKKY